MCEKFYRYCPECGDNVHMNFTCACGNDPWGKDSQRAERFTNLLRMKAEAQSQIKKAEKTIQFCDSRLKEFPAHTKRNSL